MEDPRFAGIPVMMHSSHSASENKKIGMKVGADAYAPKLVVKKNSITLIALISGTDQTIIDKECHVA